MSGDYSSDQSTVLQTTGAVVDPGFLGVNARLYFGTITLASQAKSKTIDFFTIKAGEIPYIFGFLTDTSLGSAKVSVGISGSAAKYRASATYTTTDTVTWFNAAATHTALTADEEILVSNDGTAALPASGELRLFAIVGRH